jgi:hypothetical protein
VKVATIEFSESSKAMIALKSAAALIGGQRSRRKAARLRQERPSRWTAAASACQMKMCGAPGRN